MSADTPRLRESGASLAGIKIRSKGKLTTARMTRILRLMALTPTKFGAWSGFSLPEYIRENPTMTERQASVVEGPPGFFELLQENYAAIDGAA